MHDRVHRLVHRHVLEGEVCYIYAIINASSFGVRQMHNEALYLVDHFLGTASRGLMSRLGWGGVGNGPAVLPDLHSSARCAEITSGRTLAEGRLWAQRAEHWPSNPMWNPQVNLAPSRVQKGGGMVCKH